VSGRLRKYEGAEITVSFDLKRCIHAEECIRGLDQVFDRHSRPWVNPDGAPAEDVAAVVRRCPTGALSFETSGETEEAPTPAPPEFTVLADGPIYVHGAVTLQAGDEVGVQESRLALCRCGASNNKPLCDNSHSELPFEDAGSILREGGDADVAAGDLTLSPVTDGPILLRGPFTIVSADGTQVFRGEKAALCRCGESANKPFCDGAHKSVGFKT
jgi:CDGSH-type Zn-finger protein/uncharacterized Fe-S cluster protein YjdI